MPLYEYACDACGGRFERIQKFSDPPVAECPTCGGAVRKLISSPAIQFKGSGWYITDYARASESKSGDAGKEGAGKTDGGSTAKADGGGKTEGKASEKADSGSKSDTSSKTSESASSSTPSKPAATKG
jgi:putative FmdB family regulatory protein